ncbi:hypothetical protein AB1L88_03620 [Tautonia sp. JC769]|uniref:hypothetical protein n=1 Tax=Tautonia sp. JC769 TaxID=3232135 RepID=UPI00345B06B9
MPAGRARSGDEAGVFVAERAGAALVPGLAARRTATPDAETMTIAGWPDAGPSAGQEGRVGLSP